MRVIAGKYGGRRLSRPKTTSTRPMSDKVREALFDLIGPIEGWLVLDAYAGSGAIAIEALSRGAIKAVAIELAPEPLRSIRSSQTSLSIGTELKILAAPVAKAVKKLPEKYFNLIVADPPYNDIDEDTLAKMRLLLAPGGLLILSHSSRIAPPALESMKHIDMRTYGDASLSLYKT